MGLRRAAVIATFLAGLIASPSSGQVLREFKIEALEPLPEAGIPVFVRFPGAAVLEFRTTLGQLEFVSNLDAIAHVEGEPDTGTYILLIEPVQQIIEVRSPGFNAGYLRVPKLSSKEFRFYHIEPAAPLISGRGNLTVLTDPEDATITLDGVAGFSATTPYTLEQQSAQQYLLRIRKEKHLPIDTLVTVADGESRLLRFELTPTFGVLELQTPNADRVLVAGGEHDPRIETFVEVPVGEHDLFVEADYHVRATRRVSVAPGSVVPVSVVLDRAQGFLKIETKPSGAAVYLDGRRLGDSPWADSVNAGPHEVRVRAEGYEDSEARILVEAGARVSREYRLLAKERTSVKIERYVASVREYTEGQGFSLSWSPGRFTSGDFVRLEHSGLGFGVGWYSFSLPILLDVELVGQGYTRAVNDSTLYSAVDSLDIFHVGLAGSVSLAPFPISKHFFPFAGFGAQASMLIFQDGEDPERADRVGTTAPYVVLGANIHVSSDMVIGASYQRSVLVGENQWERLRVFLRFRGLSFSRKGGD